MSRLPRLVVPGYPHHVTQRGSRGQRTFFSAADYRAYLRLLAESRAHAGIDVWAYCLMPNHVHLVVVPARADSLSRSFREAHRKYACLVNRREGWQGHLWQERFHSCVMDERHLVAAVRYVELNPVRAGLCCGAQEWEWSSARAHLNGEDDQLVRVDPMLEIVGVWQDYLDAAPEDSSSLLDSLREHGRSGRPLGGPAFVETVEKLTGRRLRRSVQPTAS